MVIIGMPSVSVFAAGAQCSVSKRAVGRRTSVRPFLASSQAAKITSPCTISSTRPLPVASAEEPIPARHTSRELSSARSRKTANANAVHPFTRPRRTVRAFSASAIPSRGSLTSPALPAASSHAHPGAKPGQQSLANTCFIDKNRAIRQSSRGPFAGVPVHRGTLGRTRLPLSPSCSARCRTGRIVAFRPKLRETHRPCPDTTKHDLRMSWLPSHPN